MTKEEFLKTLDEKFSNEDFYNLCCAFMDAGLNSSKIRMEDGSIAGKFYEDDINKAAEQVKIYKSRHTISDEELKRAIRVHAHNVVSDDDKRQKMYFDQESKERFANAHVVGTLYFFTDLPDNIVEDIFKKSKE